MMQISSAPGLIRGLYPQGALPAKPGQMLREKNR